VNAQAEPIDEDDLPGTTALVPSCSVDAILAKRDGVVRWAEQIDELVRNAPIGCVSLYCDSRRGQRDRWDLATVKLDADRSGWAQVMNESGLYSFLDAVARKAWEEQIEKGTFPALTAENIESTMHGVHSARPMMVARGVLDVFRGLSGNYNTNLAGRFGKRMILRHVLDVWGVGPDRQRFRSPHHHACDKLDDLTRFLCKMRGGVEPDHRHGSSHTLREGISGLAPWVVEFDYFTVRLFLNGNGHLTFKHQADIDRLNRALAYSAKNEPSIADDKRHGRY